MPACNKNIYLNQIIFSGGVYNSPEANEYWARRFGFLGFGENLRGLAALQANINAQAFANRP